MDFIEIQTEEDFEKAYLLLRELAPSLERKQFMKSLKNEHAANHKLFGLKDTEEMVSVAAVWILLTGLNEKIFWIHAYVTAASKRSHGYGSKLLNYLEEYAKNEGFSEIRVHAHRQRAISFWQEKKGFEPFSQILHRKINVG